MKLIKINDREFIRKSEIRQIEVCREAVKEWGEGYKYHFILSLNGGNVVKTKQMNDIEAERFLKEMEVEI